MLNFALLSASAEELASKLIGSGEDNPVEQEIKQRIKPRIRQHQPRHEEYCRTPEPKRGILDRKRIEETIEFSLEFSKKCSLVLGCLALDSLTQLCLEDTNSIGLGITAINSMFSDTIEQYVGKGCREKINQGLFVAGLCLSPKVTVASYVLNFGLSKMAGQQVSAAVIGCVAMDNAMKTYLLASDPSRNNINVSMVIATASSLMPDLVEQILGTSYRERFEQAVFVAGLCLAPEITLGSYALSYALDAVAGIYVKEDTVPKKVFNYFSARAGGIAGKLTSFMRIKWL